MAYERTWQFLPMTGPFVAPHQYDGPAWAAWNLKAFLKGDIGGATQGLWTVNSSCNGVTAGTPGDGVDRWGSSYSTYTQIGYTPNSNITHGWMVLQRSYTVYSVTYTVYLTITACALNNYTTNMYRIYMSLGAPTGGTTLASPTQSQQFFYTYAPSNASALLYNIDTSNQRRMYGGLTTLGDFWIAETLLGEVQHAFIFQNPSGCKTNDQCPFVTAGGYLFQNAYNGGPLSNYNLFVRTGTANEISPGFPGGRFYNGTPGFPQFVQPPPHIKLDDSDVSLYDYPVWTILANVGSGTPTQTHARGRLVDMGLNTGYVIGNGAPSALRPVPPGTVIRDNLANVQYITLNAMIVPYNALVS